MAQPSTIQRLEAIFEHPVTGCRPLGQTWGLEVLKVDFAAGPSVLVKAGAPELPGHLEIEAFMLRELRVQSDLPVPGVLHCEPLLLAMEWIENDGPPRSPAHERHAAELLAELHNHSASAFGYGRNTVIGGLLQPNGEGDSWVDFFVNRRLLYMGRLALGEGVLEAAEFGRLETLAGRLERYLEEPVRPSLLHGDLWQGNILVKGEKIAGMIDPAVYFGHREIELAFTTLFGRSYVPAVLRVLDRLGV